MTPDRWRQIQDIFHAALDQPPAVRDSFLDQRCAGDQELRNSVAQLLAADAQSSVMVDRPIGSVAVGVLPAEETESLAGRVFNHYRIECEIGSGGMGRVYRAYDTLLNRPVALKLLPRSFTANAERVRRFQQEARVVSALNHPYIITIHEIGEIDGLRFIVTEFVDGQTLAQIIAHGERDLLTLLRIITQSTEALAAAHEAGIVHRDIKPDNIMVRHDGYVKILDFGIAKSSHETDFDDRADLTEGSSQVLTAPGLLLGTLKYMSPEQARSEIVDARSDIFSLGVVLCEALTCQAPFAGPTRGDLLVAITQQAPPRITDYVPEAPEQLQRIIDRALQKNRDERYQSMRELHRDLERLMDEISAGRDQLETLENAAAAPLRQRLAGQIKRFRFLTILALLVIAVAVALGLYRWRKSTSAAAFSFQQIRFTKLTFAGTTEEVAGSADGKYLVYSSHEPNGSWNLWLQQTGANNPVAIETTVNGPYLHPVFSPDGQYIYFKALDKDDPKNKSLYQVSTSGGAARKLFSDIYNGVAVSPDGSELAFTRVKPDRTGYQLVVRKLSTTEERVVLTETGLDHEVAWSPDGQTLTTVINEVGPDKQQATRIVSVGVRTGAIESWSNFRMRVIDDIAWSPDGTGVFVVASNSVAPTQIWYVPYRRGAAQRVTNDLNRYLNISVVAATNKILVVQSVGAYNIWLLPATNLTRGAPITSASSNYTGISWLDEQQIITTAHLTEAVELWRLRTDGSELQQVTFDGSSKASPKVCGDGRYVVFLSGAGGRLNLWRINRDGGGLLQLTDLSQVTNPDCLPGDGGVVFGLRDQAGVRSILRVSLDGGPTQKLVDGACRNPLVSPDGRFLADEFVGPGPPRVVIRSLADLAVVRTIELPGSYDGSLAWSPDGTGFTFADNRSGSSEIYEQALAGGAARKLTAFGSQRILSSAWSPGGRQLAVIRGQTAADVVEISNLK